ncbi:MAG TPA: DEAD/DEAH box helicase family protein, partial [Acidimicrobiia bacterium]
MTHSISLFDYQSEGVAEIRAAYRSGARGVLYVLPTGGGKTVVSTYIAKAAQEKGTRVLFSAHRRELVLQLSAALSSWGVEHGVIAPWCRETRHPVQVASKDTLARRIKLDRDRNRYEFDLIVTDEAHHLAPGTQWAQVLEHSPAARYLGITATPCRLDGKPLGRAVGGFFDVMVEGPTICDLIERGRLARPVVYRPAEAPDLSAVRVKRGEFDQEALADAMDKQSLTGDAIEHYRRHCDRVPSIAFCVNLVHAAHVAEAFQRAGYSAAMLSGKTPDKERERMIRDLGTGGLNVLVSVNTV